MQHARLAFIAMLGAVYAVASHVLMTRWPTAPWAIVVLLGPVLAMLLGLAWRVGHHGGAALAAVALAATIVVAARGGVRDLGKLYLLQHAGIHLALGLAFAATLRPGRTAMIGLVAQRVQAMTPALQRYTDGLTRLWAGYFFGMALLSCAVWRWLPWPVWSMLANVVTPICIAVLFVGEHLLRHRLHPEFERTTLADTVRAYRAR